MPAPASIERIREDVERALGNYVVRRCERSGWRVMRTCKSGETHVGFFLTETAAEDFLVGRLAMMTKRAE